MLLLSDANAAAPFSDKALMLATSKKRQPHSAMFTTVLVMIPEAIHIFVSPSAISDTACIWSKTLFHFPNFTFAHALLDHLTLFTGSEITGAVGHVVLQTVCLLV